MIKVSFTPNKKLRKFLEKNLTSSKCGLTFKEFFNLKFYLMEDYVCVKRYYDKKTDAYEKRYKIYIKGKLADDLSFEEYTDRYAKPSYISFNKDFSQFKVNNMQMLYNFISACERFFYDDERLHYTIIESEKEISFNSVEENKVYVEDINIIENKEGFKNNGKSI